MINVPGSATPGWRDIGRLPHPIARTSAWRTTP